MRRGRKGQRGVLGEKSPISFYSPNAVFVPATVPNCWFFTCLSPGEDRQPPEGEPGSAHLNQFLISGLGEQQARALFRLRSRAAQARALGCKWGRERHALRPRPTQVGKSPGSPGQSRGAAGDRGKTSRAARPLAVNRHWPLQSGLAPSASNAAALTNRQRSGGHAQPERRKAGVLFAWSGGRGLGWSSRECSPPDPLGALLERTLAGCRGREACVTLDRLCSFPGVSLAILSRRLADRGGGGYEAERRSDPAGARMDRRGNPPAWQESGGRRAENLGRDCPCGKAGARRSPPLTPPESRGSVAQAPPPQAPPPRQKPPSRPGGPPL